MSQINFIVCIILILSTGFVYFSRILIFTVFCLQNFDLFKTRLSFFIVLTSGPLHREYHMLIECNFWFLLKHFIQAIRRENNFRSYPSHRECHRLIECNFLLKHFIQVQAIRLENNFRSYPLQRFTFFLLLDLLISLIKTY